VSFGCAASGHRESATYVVQPHDTLYSIAWRHDLDYHDVARWNHIGPDNRIAVGQVLLLRAPDRSAGARSAAPVGAPSRSIEHTLAAPSSPAAASPGSARSSAAQASVHWLWPTESTSAPRAVPGGGILLTGQLGQPVRAAAAGRVVYVGNGLRAYGNLIIIKHGENWLSAYAHVSESQVREGQEVWSGQPIARMGEGPHQIAALYFEIRLNGKPVDPMPYLTSMK